MTPTHENLAAEQPKLNRFLVMHGERQEAIWKAALDGTLTDADIPDDVVAVTADRDPDYEVETRTFTLKAAGEDVAFTRRERRLTAAAAAVIAAEDVD